MEQSEDRNKRILQILVGIIIVIIVCVLAYLVLKKREVGEEQGPRSSSGTFSLNDSRNDVRTGVKMDPASPQDVEANPVSGTIPTVTERIQIPDPVEQKSEAPLPYVVRESSPGPVTIGYVQGIPPMDTGVGGVQAQSFSYEQLKALKQELIQLCRENLKLTPDGSALRDRFITIFNKTLDLSITTANIAELEVVYQPQVSEVIQSIDTVTCKDTNPSIPKQE